MEGNMKSVGALQTKDDMRSIRYAVYRRRGSKGTKEQFKERGRELMCMNADATLRLEHDMSCSGSTIFLRSDRDDMDAFVHAARCDFGAMHHDSIKK